MKKGVFIPVAALLAACGSESGNNQFAGRSPEEIEAMMGQGSGGAPVDAGVGRGQASAPGEARTADELGLNCNAVAAQRGEGPDVAGVTIGMSADQALQKLACSNRALRVAFSDQGGFTQPLPDGRRPRTTISGEGPQERVVVALVGLPGQERVVTIRRTLEFAAGQEPVITNTIAQLEQKYGALAHNPAEYGRWTGHSLRDANNRPIAPNDSLLGARCALSVGMQAGQPDLQGDCGLAVSVDIRPSSSNEQLAGRLVVSMNNGAFGVQLVEAYRAHANGAAQQQQSQEVDQAAGRRPTL